MPENPKKKSREKGQDPKEESRVRGSTPQGRSGKSKGVAKNLIRKWKEVDAKKEVG